MQQPLVTCKMMGGYGNQLFILAATFAYAIKYNCKVVLPEFWEDKRPSYWKTAFKQLQSHVVHPNEMSNLPWTILGELPDKSFYQFPPPPTNCIMFFGYFQIPDFFSDYKEIKYILKLPEEYIRRGDYSNSLIIHVRRGDYLKAPDCHPIQPLSYYEEALTHFPESLQRIYVGEDKEWIQSNLLKNKRPTDILLSLESDLQEFGVMIQCKNFIIANSSFSWWAAHMAEYPDEMKKVVAPKNWFGPACRQVCQILPKDWIII